jgi:hypothetical protein
LEGSDSRDPYNASPKNLTQSAGASTQSQPALATSSSNHTGEVRENVAA